MPHSRDSILGGLEGMSRRSTGREEGKGYSRQREEDEQRQGGKKVMECWGKNVILVRLRCRVHVVE